MNTERKRSKIPGMLYLPVFFLENNIITGLWASIFLASSGIYLLLRFPLSIIISNVLVALGIAFSIIFPVLAPGYLAMRGLRKE